MINLYSPPTGGYPQEVPDYWRFADGTVRRDLQSLSPQALNNLGWTGPISIPVAKQVDDEGNIINEGEYDYDGETHKAIWYSRERKFVIIPKEESEIPYLDNQVFPPKPDAKWTEFETIVLQSPEMKNFISVASAQNPLVASAFPAAFYEVKKGDYSSFLIVWNEIKKISPLDPLVIASMVGVATSCNLPTEFISIIQG